MRAWLLVCAALALAQAAAQPPSPSPPHPPPPPPPARVRLHSALPLPRPDPARLDHIKTQILAKLGLPARPRPQGAPPRDVVRQILARAAAPAPPEPRTEHTDPAAMREIIAIAHRGLMLRESSFNPGSNSNAPSHKLTEAVPLGCPSLLDARLNRG